MYNIAVVKIKDILKILFIIFFMILMIISFNFFSNKFKSSTKNVNSVVQKEVKMLTTQNLLGCMEQTLPVMQSINEKKIEEKTKETTNPIIETQLNIASILKKDEEEKKKETVTENIEIEKNTVEENKENQIKNENIEDKLPTQVITNNPIAESFNVQYGNVKIKNQTDYQLTDEMMNPDITIENKNIVLFHTHSCESYTSSELYQYMPTGNFRTTDLNFTVTRVGTELETYLKQFNYNVIHNTSYHDYPSYNGSYTNSLKTVEGILKENPSDIIIDLHRDAIGSRSDYAPIVKIGENDIAAQLMFVIGTNNGGLWHPNWNQNLKFAIKVQAKAEEMYPGLFKPMMLTTSRYNQHTGKFASIIEVGATGNTLEQCLTSMKYLAKVMDKILNE